MRTLLICLTIIIGSFIISDGISKSNLSAQERIELEQRQQQVASEFRQEAEKQLAKEKAEQLAEQKRVSEKVEKYGKESLSEKELTVWYEIKIINFMDIFARVLMGIVAFSLIGTMIMLFIRYAKGKTVGVID
ncbi:hypothetical protein [Photobacterium leiognathi]|uniref:hypothetical protein n=1 Tax=Photobacterium leiognathi TaxID=553611 RepID=UPI0029812FB6|nr:hypothetical protein [Photobacterium leiognathi]